MNYKLASIYFLTVVMLPFNLTADSEWEDIPNEYWSCIGDNPTFSISPGGKYLAILKSPREDVCDIEQDKVKRIEEEWSWQSLSLIDLNTMESKIISDGSPGKGVASFMWLSDDRYMYSPQRNETGRNANAYGNLFAVNVDGSKRSTISESKFGQMGYQGISIYNRLDDEPEYALAKSNLRRAMVSDFVKINTFTGKVKKLANGFSPKNAKGHRVYNTLTDKDGYPVGAWVDEGIDRVIYTYDRPNDEWSEHARFKCHEPFFLPLSYSDKGWLVSGSKFSPSGEVIENNDTNAIYLYDPKTRTFGEKLYQDPRYDIGGFTGGCRNASGGAAVDYDTKKLEYVYWTSHKPEKIFFDEELAQLYGSLDQVFPNEWVTVVTRDKKRTKMVLLVSSSTNPGDYYFYDRTKGTLIPLYTKSPWIDRELMSPKIPVTYTARDGLEIPAYLSLTKKETKHKYMVMLPHGGPNTKQAVGFDWWVQFFVNKGYNVLQMDFRGSTGLGTNHYVLGNSAWGKTMQDDISDGVFWAIENGFADKDRVCIAGASYGGYATMAGLVFTPELYRCGINSVGVVNQEFILEGFSTRSSIFNSWEDEAQLEWGNLGTAEGKKYADETSPINFIDNMTAPVLVLQGTNDTTVPPEHARQLIRTLERKNKEYMSMFQAKEGHCVKCLGEKATLEYFDIQEEFLKKYLEN